MISLKDLNKFLTNLLYYDKKLNLVKIDPFMANGLMVKGTDKIKKIGLAVSASIEVFKRTTDADCQALIVHHAFSYPPSTRYDQLFQNRYSYLIKNGLSLFGYHFLLDSHPKIGHNVEIIKAIGGQPTLPFLHKGNPWGFFGSLNAVPLTTITKRLKPKISPQARLYPFGPKSIKKVAVVSGRGTPLPPDIQYLLDNQVDLFITGEDSEWIREIFREVKINYLAGGHYHSERFGLFALQKIINQKIRLETAFIELENQV